MDRHPEAVLPGEVAAILFCLLISTNSEKGAPMDSPCNQLPKEHQKFWCRELTYLGLIALFSVGMGLGANALKSNAEDLAPWDKQLPWLGSPEELGP